MDQNEDYRFFLQNIEDLYKTYGHKFLAIKDRNVLGAYDTFNDAFEHTQKTEQLGTFLIQECLENKQELIQYLQGNVLLVPAGNIA